MTTKPQLTTLFLLLVGGTTIDTAVSFTINGSGNGIYRLPRETTMMMMTTTTSTGDDGNTNTDDESSPTSSILLRDDLVFAETDTNSVL